MESLNWSMGPKNQVETEWFNNDETEGHRRLLVLLSARTDKELGTSVKDVLARSSTNYSMYLG